MANPMTAREAWEIVKGGNPMHRRYPEEWEVMRYARACAIVEARLELLDLLDGDTDAPLDVVAKTRAKVRARERGEKEGGA